MSESNAPIFIIVGTLVSVTTIAISTGLLHDFASSSAEHEDRHEFNRLLNSLESQCENVEASQDTRFSTTEEIDLRDAEIELSVSDDPKLIYHSDERDLSEDINCEPILKQILILVKNLMTVLFLLETIKYMQERMIMKLLR